MASNQILMKATNQKFLPYPLHRPETNLHRAQNDHRPESKIFPFRLHQPEQHRPEGNKFLPYNLHQPETNLHPESDLNPDPAEDLGSFLDVSKFCETILEEFQNGDLDDLEELRHFIKIAPKPDGMKNLTAYLLNLRKKASLLRLAKPKPKRTYPCEKCGKVFGWPTDLKRHVLIHSGLRPFSCQHCGSSFNRSCLLKKHVSKLHPNRE
ncbi:hypothetical protein M8J75_007680 [Diaphorina citri]|nr:hypothetical protein M8J75_007680 [Diaphorina citri]